MDGAGCVCLCNLTRRLRFGALAKRSTGKRELACFCVHRSCACVCVCEASAASEASEAAAPQQGLRAWGSG